MKRRILLVDDEVAVLLTLKAVLEISGFDVDTATSAREGKSRIKHREYEMVITDMRMEDDHAGHEVIAAAKEAPYNPAVALLTAFPVDDDALGSMGADKMLVKPMHTRVLLQQLEALFTRHTAAKEKAAVKSASKKKSAPAKRSVSIAAAEKPSPGKKSATPKKSAPVKSVTTKKSAPPAMAKSPVAKKTTAKMPAKPPAKTATKKPAR
ncbi:MAG: response regulator [Janthinobacterium lividum]